MSMDIPDAFLAVSTLILCMMLDEKSDGVFTVLEVTELHPVEQCKNLFFRLFHRCLVVSP
jgi:hypothetical protein